MAEATLKEKPEDLKAATEPPKYSEDEQKFRDVLIQQLEQARTNREQTYIEFDGMTYQDYWRTNAKAGNAYIRPKRNVQDVRITTGTTREKKNTLISNLLNYTFNTTVTAFDKNDYPVQELGEVLGDLIRKSRLVERPQFEDIRVDMYNELFTQGDVFVEDGFLEYSIPNREMNDLFGTSLSDLQWTEKMDQIVQLPYTEIITGLNFYPGNIREMSMDRQPFIVKRRFVPYEEAKAIWEDWERWKNVPMQLTQMMQDGSDSVPYNEWTLDEFRYGLVEDLTIQWKWTNNYMRMLNGVMMFPVKRDTKGRLSTVPLSFLTGKPEYTIVHGRGEPIPNFFYGKSIPAKTKIPQQIFDEFLKELILRNRKKNHPPRANLTGTTIPKSIDIPGSIHDGINPEKIPEIGDNSGIGASDMTAVQFIKGIIDDESFSSIIEGKNPEKKQTAKATMNQQQQATLKLGLTVYGVVNLHKNLDRLRLLNINRNWTRAQDSSIDGIKDAEKNAANNYRTITIDSKMDDGEQGKRVVEFVKGQQNVPTNEQTLAQSQLLSDKYQTKVKMNVLDVDILTKMDYTYYFDTQAEQKDAGELKSLMFDEFTVQTMQIFPELSNKEFFFRKRAINHKIDPDKAMVKPQAQPGMPQPGQPGQPQPGEPAGATAGGKSIADKMAPSQPQQPSINTVGA